MIQTLIGALAIVGIIFAGPGKTAPIAQVTAVFAFRPIFVEMVFVIRMRLVPLANEIAVLEGNRGWHVTIKRYMPPKEGYNVWRSNMNLVVIMILVFIATGLLFYSGV